MGENDHKLLKTEFPDKWKYLKLKLAGPYEYFKSLDDYKKPVNDLKIGDFFSKLKNECLVIQKKKEQWILLKDSILKKGKN